MRFCPKCDSRMKIKRVKKGDKVVPMYVCVKCGYMEPADKTEAMKLVENEEEVIKVVGDEIRTLPTVEVVCPNCGYNKAVWWMAQTRSGDEPSTQFFRCLRCGYTWRQYA